MNRNTAQMIVALVFVILVLILLVVGPFFTIWSLNTLFGLEIPVNFKTWCAVVWLMTVFHGIRLSLKKNE